MEKRYTWQYFLFRTWGLEFYVQLRFHGIGVGLDIIMPAFVIQVPCLAVWIGRLYAKDWHGTPNRGKL
ncbi:MAG: hypothetical protein AMJ88_13580 [Anaerolineae bacterium SM23_ 63]|nr:MAG: hypothetical protein AMJ88_13580 [Anaerolineae bacterium SM23_ 63]